MTDRGIFEWKVNLKDSRLTPEQKAKVYDLIEEHHDAFRVCDEIGTCTQVRYI